MILVKFEKEVKGTVTVKGHEDWIEFSSYSLSVTRHIQVQGADRDVSQANISELMLTKGADKTSPEFFIQALKGRAFDKATIVVMHAAGSEKPSQRLLTIELTKPIVSSFSTQNSTNNRPEEHISLNYTAINYKYYHFDGDIEKGSVEKSYDVIAKA
ncbi:type VI secretion system tube protein Hcp [Pseudomonas sp. GD03860]|uniref:Hcp family type VI secretion system effector n=1 Tax=Pseudomonas TaxID=286 RepID=UPI00236352FB|nr:MULTISPECIES: type VI secretion system tube protein Hcp [Pseudomonas]MDD2058598.1 type VI secretion system tube protein Hcp [Pseudomonas putida]MDH0639537.1 type VI secretion system tube protein Hcp [Pseudomonas sp. GD03860]